MGAVTVVPLESAEPIELPQGSWSRMLVTGARVNDNALSLGYSVFTPGTVLTPVKHETEEVAFAAIEDFTHGTAVVDGVMLGIGLPGQVEEPIRWTLEGGKCVAIEGGEDAERLRKAIDGVENATVIGEFAFGTSEKAPFGTPSEKGRIGTVHLALGDNHNAYPGGQNHCSLHLDGVFLNATLQIVDDGTYILKDGEWAL